MGHSGKCQTLQTWMLGALEKIQVRRDLQVRALQDYLLKNHLFSSFSLLVQSSFSFTYQPHDELRNEFQAFLSSHSSTHLHAAYQILSSTLSFAVNTRWPWLSWQRFPTALPAWVAPSLFWWYFYTIYLCLPTQAWFPFAFECLVAALPTFTRFLFVALRSWPSIPWYLCSVSFSTRSVSLALTQVSFVEFPLLLRPLAFDLFFAAQFSGNLRKSFSFTPT